MSGIGGFKPGDQVGLGVVINPADIKPTDRVKQVTVDIDLDGKISTTDDKILVKLPPKGVIPSNIAGFENKNDRTLSMAKSVTLGGTLGAIGAGVVSVVGSLAAQEIFGLADAAVAKTTGIGAAIGLVAGAGVAIFVNHQKYESNLEKASDRMVPDIVKPKMILNLAE